MNTELGPDGTPYLQWYEGKTPESKEGKTKHDPRPVVRFLESSPYYRNYGTSRPFRNIDGLRNHLKELHEEILVMEETQKTQASTCVLMKKNIDLIVVDTDKALKLKTKIENADKENEKIKANNELKETIKDLVIRKKLSDDLTMDLNAIKRNKSEMIKKAKLPIDNIEFDDMGIRVGGVLFEQLNSAEQLKVSINMAMALNPKLKVIKINNGSLLDSDNMKIIEDAAKGKGYQVWIEKVDESEEVGIVIEEGRVKKINK